MDKTYWMSHLTQAFIDLAGDDHRCYSGEASAGKQTDVLVIVMMMCCLLLEIHLLAELVVV